MKQTKLFTCYGFLLTVLLGMFSNAKSKVYTVGDEEQWADGRNYLNWSKKYNFSVGDVLVFKYVKGQHNAYEVEETTYKSCDASTGVLAKYESGNDQVNLTEARNYWFICNITGHCPGGMRFTINVKEANATNSPSTEPTPPTNKCYASNRPTMGIMYLLGLGFLLKLFLLT